jgi:hypothetical protein
VYLFPCDTKVSHTVSRTVVVQPLGSRFAVTNPLNQGEVFIQDRMSPTGLRSLRISRACFSRRRPRHWPYFLRAFGCYHRGIDLDRGQYVTGVRDSPALFGRRRWFCNKYLTLSASLMCAGDRSASGRRLQPVVTRCPSLGRRSGLSYLSRYNASSPLASVTIHCPDFPRFADGKVSPPATSRFRGRGHRSISAFGYRPPPRLSLGKQGNPT